MFSAHCLPGLQNPRSSTWTLGAWGGRRGILHVEEGQLLVTRREDGVDGLTYSHSPSVPLRPARWGHCPHL